MTKDEALRLALEALTVLLDEWTPARQAQLKGMDAITAIKAALEARDEPVAHSVVAGALFDFMGWLTSREKRLILSSVDEASPAVEAITEFAKKRNLSLKYAEVGYWMEFLSTPPQQEAKDELMGWKLVPIEPTNEMLKAMDECSTEGYDERLPAGIASSVYMAAVEVAPKPPQQKINNEPKCVAIVEVFGKDWRLDYMALPVGKHKLYAQQYLYTTLPPQRTWVGLTDEEWEAMYYKFAKHQEYGAFVSGWDKFARAIEAKLKEKNT